MNREALEQVREALAKARSCVDAGASPEHAAWAQEINSAHARVDAALASLEAQPTAGEAMPVAKLWLGSGDKTPAESFVPLPAMYDLPKGAHQLYAAPVKVEAQPQLYNFSSFDDWWLPHGKYNALLYNALFSASLGATPSEQIKKSHELMKLTWQVARELAASPSTDAPGGEDKP
jgi:hypothetical protein